MHSDTDKVKVQQSCLIESCCESYHTGAENIYVQQFYLTFMWKE